VPLGEIIELAYGKSLPARLRRSGSIPVYGANGIAGYHDQAIVPEPTIIVGRKGSAGEIQLTEVSSFPIDTTYYVVRREPATLDLQFLYSALLHLNLARLRTSTGVPGLNREDAYRETVPLPPLAEQRRIVEILNHANRIRRLRREAIAKARELIPALFIQMFGDPARNPKNLPVVPLGELLDACDYGTSRKATSDPVGPPMLRMGNVTTAGDLDLTDLKYANLPAGVAEKYSLCAGDLLFNRTNSKDLVGKTGIWDREIRAVAASYFIRLRVSNERVSPCYVWAFFNTKYMKYRLYGTARGAIGQANINARELKAFSIPVPPIALQHEFADRVRDIQSLVFRHEQQAAGADTLHTSLASRCFQ